MLFAARRHPNFAKHMLRAIAVISGALALTACGGQTGEQAQTSGRTSFAVSLSDKFTGDFDLVGKDGARVRDEDLEGKTLLVYFGFTNCPDVCPGDISMIAAALNELGDHADAVTPVFISVDPERDTPEALAEYFSFDERFVALTGSEAAIKATKEAFFVYAEKQELPESALKYTVNHTRLYYVLDRSGTPQIAISEPDSPQSLAKELRAYL